MEVHLDLVLLSLYGTGLMNGCYKFIINFFSIVKELPRNICL